MRQGANHELLEESTRLGDRGHWVFGKCGGEKASRAWLPAGFGDGSATREFLYVDDAAEGILLAADRYDKPEPGIWDRAWRSASKT